MIKRTFFTLLITAAMLTQAHHSNAQLASLTENIADSWTLLGTKKIDHTLDRDVVMLESAANYKSMKFVVKSGTLNIDKCTIHFADGGTKEVDFSKEGSYSKDGSYAKDGGNAKDSSNAKDGRTFDLASNDRSIEKVTFWYDSKDKSDNKSGMKSDHKSDMKSDRKSEMNSDTESDVNANKESDVNYQTDKYNDLKKSDRNASDKNTDMKSGNNSENKSVVELWGIKK